MSEYWIYVNTKGKKVEKPLILIKKQRRSFPKLGRKCNRVVKKISYENWVMPQKMKAVCSKCSGLCCTALFFSKMDGFPEDKPDGKPCMNLTDKYQCEIHSKLDKKGMRGCIGYDCFGAGQYV